MKNSALLVVCMGLAGCAKAPEKHRTGLCVRCRIPSMDVRAARGRTSKAQCRPGHSIDSAAQGAHQRHSIGHSFGSSRCESERRQHRPRNCKAQGRANRHRQSFELQELRLSAADRAAYKGRRISPAAQGRLIQLLRRAPSPEVSCVSALPLDGFLA